MANNVKVGIFSSGFVVWINDKAMHSLSTDSKEEAQNRLRYSTTAWDTASPIKALSIATSRPKIESHYVLWFNSNINNIQEIKKATIAVTD